ncbi:MAG TPA: VWA domain-containing protein [Vicinamibacterales bacterium]|nr:VWA domain-containing protein [Vicinamibacterales bacterium]
MVAFALGTSMLVGAQSQQKAPVFKGSVDLRQLDVTVLDKQRRPVRGLTASDFSLTEDGVPQKIEAFSFVDVPDAVPSASEPVWSRRVASDVETNDTATARAFVLVIDDGGIGDLWAKREMPKSVATFMDQLKPDDLAALVFIRKGDRSQNFTHDKARIIAAAERFDTLDNGTSGSCPTANAMKYVTENLAALKNLRKVIVYFGGSLAFDTSPADPCGLIWSQFVQLANENNVTAYAVDTMGLRPRTQRANDAYLELAHHTGGRAVINSNAFEEGLTAIVAENTSYYLLAYQPTQAEADGRFRRVQVTVNRPDVEVVSNRNYWAPKGTRAEVAQPAAAASTAGVLPVSDLPLRATAAAFRGAESGAAILAVAVAMEQGPFPSRARDQVDFTATAFMPNGEMLASDRQNLSFTVPAAAPGADASRYQALSRLDLTYPYRFAVTKLGSYELRVSAGSEVTGRRGSIYLSVDVPDFDHDDVSLSGVVINSALSGTPTAPTGVLRDVVPFTPTVNRVFTTGDIVTAFLRVYQGGTDKLRPVPIKTTMQDGAGKSVLSKTETIAADRFGNARGADVQFRVPLSDLKPGEYLLTFEAMVGKVTARRDVRFSVR